MAGSCGDPDARPAVVAPSERDAQLGNFSAALKRWMRKELNASWQWQAGCFDRLLRSDESLHEKWLYIQDNPGARRPRQGLERLSIPIRVQRGTITIGEAPYLLDRALSNSHQRPASDALALQFVHRPPEFISILQRRISKSIAKDRWLRK